LRQRRRARAGTGLGTRQRCRALADALRLARRAGPCYLGSRCRDGPGSGRCIRAVVPAQVDRVGEKYRHGRRVLRPRAGMRRGPGQRLGGGRTGGAGGRRGQARISRARLASPVHTGEKHAHRTVGDHGKPGKQANRWSQSQLLGHRRALVTIVLGYPQSRCLVVNALSIPSHCNSTPQTTPDPQVQFACQEEKIHFDDRNMA
jgi:hypothetical protein